MKHTHFMNCLINDYKSTGHTDTWGYRVPVTNLKLVKSYKPF